MLCGLLTPDGGEGTCLGFDIRRESQAIKRHVGYMTQRFSLWEDLTIRENLASSRGCIRCATSRPRVEAALAQLGLADRANQLAGELSGGWKQRLALAACLLHEPQLLLLDEPTAGVDPKARRDFWDEIHELAAQGITVLVSTHYMDEAERCHRLGYILGGRLLVHGTAARGRREPAARHMDRRRPGACRAGDPAAGAAPRCEQVAAFGATLHVTGTDAGDARAALAPFKAEPGRTWRRIEPGLEDVFIHLMQNGADTIAADPGTAAAMNGFFSFSRWLGHRRQGVHPAAARPADVRHDRRHPGDPARPVRLRDQLRSRSICRRCCSTSTAASSRAASPPRSPTAATSTSSARRRARPRPTARSPRGHAQFVVTIPAGFLARAGARRTPGGAGRGRRHRSGRDRQRGRRARASSSQPALAHDLTGPLAPLAATPGAFDMVRARALQPGGHHAVQHRARPDGRDPDDDDGADDRARDHPRARARHDGEPAVHAGDARSR